MAAVARIPRRRGGLSGFLLVLLGLWGGLIPFAGPSFHYGFTPDKAWAYTSGRLYLSVLPGAVTFVAGLMVLFTRSRAAGIFGGFLAALAGAWFAAGYQIVLTTTQNFSISPGVPLPASGPARAVAVPGIPAVHATTEELGMFLGLGVVIVFFGALAVGRFSMLGAHDLAATQREQEAQREQELRDSESAATSQFPASSQQFPPTDQDTVPAGTADPAATSQFPASSQQLAPEQQEDFTPQNRPDPLPKRAAQPPPAQ
ncbi:MAG: hypothetical protein ACLP7J_29595 [Streptosporangiaceae bacterium]